MTHSTTNYHADDQWAMRSLRDRCQCISRARSVLASQVDDFVADARSDQRIDDAETIASELIPLSEALRWIGRHGAKILRDRKVGLNGRPLWMWGVRSVVQRHPHGTVLILGTWNYPIFLTGVQAAQALAAGNRVMIKPAVGAEDVTARLVSIFVQSGVPEMAIELLDSSTQTAKKVLSPNSEPDTTTRAVDFVVLTGAASTGRSVLKQTAQTLTPTVMELSGVDAVIALESANPNTLAAAIRFGLLFNSGATCIGPRRLLVSTRPDRAGKLISPILEALKNADELQVHPAARTAVLACVKSALATGAVDALNSFDAARLESTGLMRPVVLTNVPDDADILSADLFAPVMSVIEVQTEQEAIDRVNCCRYRLAASVFGTQTEANRVAELLNVGSVTINDLVAPTADPRLPFGGRGESGFGVTRGPEGLLAMTTPRIISTRRGKIAPHLRPRTDADAELLAGVLQFQHQTAWKDRWAGFRRMTTAARKTR